MNASGISLRGRCYSSFEEGSLLTPAIPAPPSVRPSRRGAERQEMDTSRTEPTDTRGDAAHVSHVKVSTGCKATSNAKPVKAHRDQAPISKVETEGDPKGGSKATAALGQSARSTTLRSEKKAHKKWLKKQSAMAAQEAGQVAHTPKADNSQQRGDSPSEAPSSKDPICATNTSDGSREVKAAGAAQASSGSKEQEGPKAEFILPELPDQLPPSKEQGAEKKPDRHLKEQVDAHWDAAFEYAEHGNLEAAEDVLRALFDDEDLRQAQLDISKTCVIEGRRFAMSRIFMTEGHRMVEKNAIEDAQGFYAFSLELSDANFEAMSGMAHVELQLGNYQETIEICTHILKSLAKSQNKNALKRRGLAFYHLGLQREAWNDLTEYLGGAPRHFRKQLGVSYAFDMFRLKLNPEVFGPNLLAPEPSHTPAAVAAAMFRAEQDAAERAVADVFGEKPAPAVVQEQQAGQPRRVNRVKVYVPEDATLGEVLCAIDDATEIMRAGDQEFVSGREAIVRASTEASEGKAARSPDMPLSDINPAASARKRKSRGSGQVTEPQAGSSPDVQASAKAGKENKQQAATASGGDPPKASAAKGTAGHKPRSAASMARATKLLTRLLDAVNEDDVKDKDPNEACAPDVDIVEAADALGQLSVSPRRMTDEEQRQQLDWAAAETPKTAERQSAAKVDQEASSSIKALLGVPTSSSSEFQAAPPSVAVAEQEAGLQGQVAAVAGIAGQECGSLADTTMDTGTAAQEQLIPGVWELQVSLVPSEEDHDIPADASVEDAASQYSPPPPNTLAHLNMALAANARSATKDLDTAELAAVGKGADPLAYFSACAAKEHTSQSPVAEESIAAKFADEKAMLSPERGTPLTAEALARFNQHNRCMPAKSPEGRTYLTPEAMKEFKAFLEDRSGTGSPEAAQGFTPHRQEPPPGSDLTPMSVKTSLFTIPEQSEAEEQDEASEDGTEDYGTGALAADTVAVHGQGQIEGVDRWPSMQSTEWAAPAASEEQPTGKGARMAPEANGAGSDGEGMNQLAGGMHGESRDSSRSTAPSMAKPAVYPDKVEVGE